MSNNQWNNQNTWNQASQAATNNFNPPANNLNNIWNDFEEVEERPARNKFIPAGLDGVVKINELKTVASIKNAGRPIFIASIEFVEGQGAEPGERFDWVAKADEQSYRMTIKSLIRSLNPEGDPATINKDLMIMLTGPDQPAKGERVRVRTEAILTSRGNDFTKVYWAPAS